MTTYLRSWAVLASEGCWPQMQLWNDGPDPIEVTDVWVTGNVPMDWGLLYFDLPSGKFPLSIAEPPFSASSPKGIAADGSLSARGELRVANAPPIIGGQMINGNVQSLDLRHIDLGSWIMPAGRGIGIRGGIPATQIKASFRWKE